MESPDARSPSFNYQAILRQCGVEVPEALAVAVDERWMQSVIRFRADAGQTSLVVARQILVQKCEGRAGAIQAERFRADAPDFFLVARFGRPRCHIAQHLNATVFDHPFRHVQSVGQDAAHVAVVIRNGAVREREVTLLEIVVAMEREHLVGERADVLAILVDRIESRSDEVPGLREHVATTATQAPGCFVPTTTP